MTWRAISARPHPGYNSGRVLGEECARLLGGRRREFLGVTAQVEFKSKTRKQFTTF